MNEKEVVKILWNKENYNTNLFWVILKAKNFKEHKTFFMYFIFCFIF